MSNFARFEPFDNKSFEEANKFLHNKHEFTNLRSGDAFGDIPLVHNEPATDNVLCITNCHFAVLPEKKFKEILLNIERKRNAILKKVLY